MDPAQVLLATIGGVVVGLSLGLVGAGGAILSMPIFTVVLGHAVGVAVLEALAVTGAVAFVSSVRSAMARRVDLSRAAAFALPGMVGAWLGGPLAKALDARLQSLLFAALALVAAWRMLASPAPSPSPPPPPAPPPATSTEGAADAARPARARARTILLSALCGGAIGVLTSVLGVGGGFLLVPALVLVTRAGMPVAVGTSLAVITVNAAVGLASHALVEGAFASIAWAPVAIVAGCGILGSLAGGRWGERLSQRTLRRVFAGLLVAVAGLVLWRGALSARAVNASPAGSAPPSARSMR